MGERFNPAHVNIAQAAFREVARGVLHYPMLRNETIIASPDGLRRAQEEFLGERRGLITIQMHFAQTDPVWNINDTTEKRGLRSVPMSGPVARHQTYPGLLLLGRTVGINMTSVVTEETMKRAERKGEKVSYKQGDGVERYLSESERTLRKGGHVFVAQSGSRTAHLTQQEKRGPSAGVIGTMLGRGLDKFGIHFVAFEIDGLEDYSQKRGFNIGQKYKVIHGNTYSAREFSELVAGPQREGQSDKQYNARVGLGTEAVVYEELARIAPSAYLLRT